MRELLTLQESPKIYEGDDFCFYYIDMAINRANEAPSEETKEGMRTKFLTQCGRRMQYFFQMWHSINVLNVRIFSC